jgi:uncharacterized protein (DUF983 family)
VAERTSTTALFWRGLRKRCPRCGTGHLFRRWFTMVERCPGCGLVFERVEGQWIGAIAMNMIATELLFGAVLVGWMVLAWPDVPWVLVGVVGVAVSGLFPLVFYPFSKTIWVAIDLRMRPVELAEQELAMRDHPDLRV